MGLFSYLWTEHFPPKDANDGLKDRLIKTPATEEKEIEGSFCSQIHPPPPPREQLRAARISHCNLPPKHFLKYLGKNQCFHKGKRITPNSPWQRQQH